VTPARIAELLHPFHVTLDELHLNQISIYIDLLLRWNARINLTAIRKPEAIVQRHFGESLFAAQHLYPGRLEAEPIFSPSKHVLTRPTPNSIHLIDVGSGSGFPGLPIKLWNPDLDVTLIESNQKKATFLREVIRALALTNVNVSTTRAETHSPATADLVTLRAVEHFDTILSVAAKLVIAQGRLGLLIGSPQMEQARRLAPNFFWNPAIPIPPFQATVLLVGSKSPTSPPVPGE
jgi:16S rRNA (guanine527-N7)-methyltransferase